MGASCRQRDVPDLVRIMQTLVEVASAMAYLHSLDILHSVSQLSGAWAKIGKQCCMLLV